MLWGLIVKNEVQIFDILNDTHISSASVEVEKGMKVGNVQVFATSGNSSIMIAQLNKRMQFVPLNIVLSKGEKIGFYTKGRGIVHLAGFFPKPDEESGSCSNEIRRTEEIEVYPSTELKTSQFDENLLQGVTIENLASGIGREAQSNDVVSICFKSYLQNSEQYIHMDTQPLQITLGEETVVPGLDKGIVGMQIGAKRRIICCPEMAYGEKGIPSLVPPNSTVVFEVELKNIESNE